MTRFGLIFVIFLNLFEKNRFHDKPVLTWILKKFWHNTENNFDPEED